MEKRRITYDNELEIMIEEYLANPLEAERLLQEQGRIKSKLPYNRETTDMFTLIGKDQDPLNEYPE